jgi:hypothetical protein
LVRLDVSVGDQIRGRMDCPATVKAIRELSARWPGCFAILIEDKANGPAVIQMLSSEISRHHLCQSQRREGCARAGDQPLGGSRECLPAASLICAIGKRFHRRMRAVIESSVLPMNGREYTKICLLAGDSRNGCRRRANGGSGDRSECRQRLETSRPSPRSVPAHFSGVVSGAFETDADGARSLASFIVRHAFGVNSPTTNSILVLAI